MSTVDKVIAKKVWRLRFAEESKKAVMDFTCGAVCGVILAVLVVDALLGGKW